MRWPEYGLAIAKHGQFSVLGEPLALDAEATQKAESFALQAEKALRLAVRIGVRQQPADDLRSAVAEPRGG